MIMPTPKPEGCGGCLATMLLAAAGGAAAAVLFVYVLMTLIHLLAA